MTIKTTLDALAPWPTTRDEVTITALAKHITADTYARLLTAHEMGKTAFRRKADPAEMAAYAAAMNHVADSFAVASLLCVIAEQLPGQADEIAADLWEEWDAGDSFAELLHGWLAGYGIDPERIIQAVKAAPEVGLVETVSTHTPEGPR